MSWFHYSVIFVVSVILGILTLVTVLAHQRTSGVTGIDMAEVKKMRNAKHEVLVLDN
jgi:hypothetical protein